MKPRPMRLVCYAILSAVCGCGPMDPPCEWKMSQIKPLDQSGPGIAVRTLEARMWGRTHYSEPAVVVTATNGVRWEIYASGEDPSKWRAYRIEPGKASEEIPLGPLSADQTLLAAPDK